MCECFGIVVLDWYCVYWVVVWLEVDRCDMVEDDLCGMLEWCFVLWLVFVMDVICVMLVDMFMKICVYDLDLVDVWYCGNVLLIGDVVYVLFLIFG